MATDVPKFFSIVFCALALAPAGAHLLELFNKIHLSADEYLVVQRIYRGWALLGLVVTGAVISTLLLAWSLRGQRGFTAAVVALLCIVATQIVFWSATFPVNAATHDWTLLPGNWERLRLRWEYSHAVGAMLNLAALLSATTSVLQAGR